MDRRPLLEGPVPSPAAKSLSARIGEPAASGLLRALRDALAIVQIDAHLPVANANADDALDTQKVGSRAAA